VAKTEEQIDRIFHALSDQTRRKLLLKIADSECRVTDLAQPFAMSLNAISKHLKVLEAAGLLKRTVDGRVHRCRADMKPLETATEVIARYTTHWQKQLDALEKFLDLAKSGDDAKNP